LIASFRWANQIRTYLANPSPAALDEESNPGQA